jgi:hypothetical protein
MAADLDIEMDLDMDMDVDTGYAAETQPVTDLEILVSPLVFLLEEFSL